MAACRLGVREQTSSVKPIRKIFRDEEINRFSGILQRFVIKIRWLWILFPSASVVVQLYLQSRINLPGTAGEIDSFNCR